MVGGDHKNTLKTTKGDEMLGYMVILLGMFIVFYYVNFFMKVEYKDFTSKKELFFSIIPFYMWFSHVKELIKELD